MCKKTQFKYCPSTIDKCMRPLIKFLNKLYKDRDRKFLSHIDYQPVACCCGHGKYPMTIVARVHNYGKPFYFELLSGTDINRSKRFYKKDAEGYYYIPEVMK